MRNLTILRRSLAVLGLALVTLGVLSSASAAASAERQSTPVSWHPQTGRGGQPSTSSATLVRRERGVSYRFDGRELEPGNVYTLWFVVVDDPSACAASPCTAADVFGVPEADAQVVYAAGSIANADGRAVFAGARRTGPIDAWNGLRFFDDPRGAEVHLVVNDHGPAVPGMVDSMLRSYRGGCSDDSPFPGLFPDVAIADGVVGPNTCLLTQVAIFRAA